jgi:hypothetical protein
MLPFWARDGAAGPLAVLSGQRHALLATLSQPGPTPSMFAYVGQIAESLSLTLAIWAVRIAVDQAGTQIASVIDIATPVTTSDRSVETVLEPLGTKVLPLGIEVAAYAETAKGVTTGDRIWMYGRVPAFIPIEPPRPPNFPGKWKPLDATLLDGILRMLSERVAVTSARATAARETLRSYSEIQLSLTNIRSQRWTLRLTIAVVILSVVTAVIGILTLEDNHSPAGTTTTIVRPVSTTTLTPLP